MRGTVPSYHRDPAQFSLFIVRNMHTERGDTG